MESKSGARVPYSLVLSCMGKYFNNLNLSFVLFGQCANGQQKRAAAAPIATMAMIIMPRRKIFNILYESEVFFHIKNKYAPALIGS
jgi:hypothetical protein